MKTRFADRSAAGEALARRLSDYAAQPGGVVIGISSGGVAVAAEVAHRLSIPLDLLVVRRLGVPCQPGLTMGAIAPDGVCILNDELIDLLDIESDAIGAVRRREEDELLRREQIYRGGRPRVPVRGRTVIVVDDGITTGTSMHAAIVYFHQQAAGRVVAAAPVVAPAALHQLRSLATEVVSLLVPPDFHSVAECYDHFSPTTDDEVRRLLISGGVPRSVSTVQ